MIIENTGHDFKENVGKVCPERQHTSVVVNWHNGKSTRERLAWSQAGILMIMIKGRQQRGYYPDWYAIDSVKFSEEKSKDVVWAESWQKVEKRLEKSGLWPDLLAEVKMALSVGFEKIQKAYDIENKYDNSVPWDIMKMSQAEEIKTIHPGLVKQRENGTFYPNTDILSHINYPARVKAMYFGKDDNKSRLEAIKEALYCKADFATFARASYDVSFSCHPENKKAFYSEQYRGMGNGHYYLALDATHALFYEDD